MKRSIMMGLCLGAVVHVSMGFGVLWPAHAYDTAAVTDGAVLRGRVTFQGTAPEPKEFELRRYPDLVFCGALSDGNGLRFLKEVTVGRDGGLKDAVVVVEGIQSGKPFAFTDAQVEANICQFLPFVTVVSDKRQLTVTNRDPVSHDIQGYAFDQGGVDIVLHRSSLKARGTTDIVQLVKGRKVFACSAGGIRTCRTGGMRSTIPITLSQIQMAHFPSVTFLPVRTVSRFGIQFWVSKSVR